MILLSHAWGSQAGSGEPKYVGSRNILYHAPDLALVTASLGLKIWPEASRCLAQDPTAHCADFYLGPSTLFSQLLYVPTLSISPGGHDFFSQHSAKHMVNTQCDFAK